MVEQTSLDFSLTQDGDHFVYATITVPSAFVKRLHNLASEEHRFTAATPGFSKGSTPLSYIAETFQPHLLDHLKEFFFKYFVINWLYKHLKKHKIHVAGEPVLTNILLTANAPASYSFSITLAQPIPLQGWKRLLFKPPKRKNYKDLDRQVTSFLKEEEEAQKKTDASTIHVGDWVLFSISLHDHTKKDIFENYHEELWLKIGEEEADSPFQQLFIGKKIGDVFETQEESIQNYFSTHFETHYVFVIKILDHLTCGFFSVDHFKKHFRIKTQKELHQKCIEVFSYRNDISQRRSTAEETLRLLLSKHPFTVPHHLILRQEKTILDAIHDNPDYQVYRMQPDFRYKLRQLAEKQVKEHILIHQLAYHENIDISNDDIKAYLNLVTRPRTTEFIYFEPPQTKFFGQELPISATLLAQCCLREKTLNHAIYYLSKNR